MKVNWEKTRNNFKGRFCAAGLDLSSVDDLTCAVYMFPREEDRTHVDVLMRTWCCWEKIYTEKNRYRDQYQAWEQEGWLQVTDGNAMDYDLVRKQIVEDAQLFDLKLIGVDRQFQGIEFSIKLGEDLGHTEKRPIVITCTNHPNKIGPVCQELERRILDRKINHGGYPILRFMIDSVAVRQDADGNRKPDKDKSQGKIDGVVSMIYALDRLMRSSPKKRKIIMPVAV